MPGWRVISPPRSLASAMTLNTPAGNIPPITRASCSVASGVVPAGLTTIVLPASSAGGILKAASISGKFQGTIAPTTPSGW